MQRLRALGVLTVALVGLAHFSNSAEAGSHSWRVSEVFSNADGTIQFIELKECCGLAGENGIHTHPVRSLTNEFPFPAPLNQGSTANKHLLLGTAAFAALPGAPTPDFIIPANFFSTTLTENIGYDAWDEPGGVLATAQGLDIPAGTLPVDGVTALHDIPNIGSGAVNAMPGVNSPTNFAGTTGSVDAGGNNPIPEVEFVLAASSVGEGGPTYTVMVHVVNTGGTTTEAITVTIDELTSGSATPGADYPSFGSATLVFPAGSTDGSALPLLIGPVDDLAVEGPETIDMAIVATSGASSVIGTNATHTVTLIDDDVPGGLEFLRADVNQDGSFDIADPIRLLGALFSNLPVTCDQAMDVNDDEAVDIADAIAALGNLFSGAPDPAVPFGACGVDPTVGTLPCGAHAACP